MTVIAAVLVAAAVALSGLLAVVGGGNAEVVRAQGTAELAALAAATAALGDHLAPCDAAAGVATRARQSLDECAMESRGHAIIEVRGDGMSQAVEARAGPAQYD
ncbi:hypothetical protein GCM10010401_06320 [Rarobacter faecitabidus]|uniref:Secretion/DNA translocation related TadE-like protein n=1 Tax=Rarobacter faecitabidus TaxID=13243 RepID=A0A542ZTD1_RARFA|nr:hypothetical protein [Rarobacter faecitabidus]TQL63618.1 hypothetical protein FB461_0084 [Rarobacter faecitabidus]